MNIRHILLGAALLSGCMPSVAQQLRLSLQECIDRAVENSPDMRVGRLSVEKAKAMQGTAFDLDKTGIALSQDPTSGGSPDNGITFSQSFEFPTVYAARLKYLKAETRLEQSSLDVARNELVRDIRLNYCALLYAREKVALLKRQDAVCAEFLRIAAARHADGEAGRLEKMNAERLLNENRLSLASAETELRTLSIEVQKLIGADAEVLPSDTALMPLALEKLPADTLDFSQTPQGGMYASMRNVSERNLKLARQAYMPDINVGFRTQFVLKGFNSYIVDRSRFRQCNLMGFEVGGSVPLFYGGKRARSKAAKRELEMTAEMERRAGFNAGKEYEACLENYLRAKKNLDYYTGRGLAGADDMARISELSYVNGEIGYVEYMQNLSSAADVRLRHADAVNEYNKAVIMLNYLQGYR